jgi:hypothetical protein
LAPHQPIAALDYEIAQEQAAALGRMGRALEQALAALAAFDPTGPSSKAARSALLQQASDALWLFIVQREASGLRNTRQVIRDYGVPAEVEARMGSFAGKGSSG